MKKKIQNLSFAVIAVAVLCAGTVSARQLHTDSKGFACGGTCSSTQPCASGCFCSFTTPFTAFCTVRPAGIAPSGK